jgi:L-lactate dehydrogenase complex protein LldG
MMSDVSQETNARQAILSSIRRHLAASAPFDEQTPPLPQSETETLAVGSTSFDQPALIERFQRELEAVAGHCVVVRNDREAAETIRRIIEETKARTIALSDSARVQQITGGLETSGQFLHGADSSALFDCDMGITGAQWAIAETGTLVLESERERHRLASLVPPVHVAILEANRIRQSMAEVLQGINEQTAEGLSRTVTFITGPSRTSDIELTLAIGVHGPGQLHVIVIDDVQQTVE